MQLKAGSFTIGISYVLVLTLLIVGCNTSDNGNASASDEGDVLTVFAATSLTEVFGEIKSDFETENPGVEVEYNFAGSQELVTQLTQGADADVFASANNVQMQAARDSGVVTADPVIFARNRLIIVVPSNNPAGIDEPADLANEDVKLVVAHPEVPVGQYARAALDKMSAAPQFGADFRSRVEDNVVSEESNVRQVVSKVQLGEADAGIVYASDITQHVAEDVTFVGLPEQFNVVAEYPVAPVRDGNTELAQRFIDYLVSDAGQTILEKHGFDPAP